MKMGLEMTWMGPVAVAICGASATLATAACLPASERKEKESVVVVMLITLFSSAAMLSYPLLAHVLNMDIRQTAVFLGTSIHDVAQVVGASYAISMLVGELATVTKLIRVALLAPLIIGLNLYFRQQASTTEKPPLIPLFLMGFILCILINGLTTIPTDVSDIISIVSRSFIAIALAGLGLKVDLSQIRSVGSKPLTLLFFCSLFLCVLSLICCITLL